MNGRVSSNGADWTEAAQDCRTLTRDEIRPLLPPRKRESQKGDNGRGLLCVGSARYTGAALLCAGAALRVGCGVLEAAVPGAVKPAFAALPEVCATAVNDGGDWDAEGLARAAERLEGKRAVGIGSGMGEAENPNLLVAALETGLPLVIDADGLNLLARNRTVFDALHPSVVLTPHAGEMARLLAIPMERVLEYPAEMAFASARAWRCNVLLKGADTYLSDGAQICRNVTGNPGLAKGGSGDVLTGLITGLLCQGLSPFDAACAGAYLLGVSADVALELLGNRMLIARDVIDAVRLTLEQRI